MDACIKCPYLVRCIFDKDFPCYLDDDSEEITLKGDQSETVQDHN